MKETTLKEQIAELDIKIDQIKQTTAEKFNSEIQELEKVKHTLESKIKALKYKESSLSYAMTKPEEIPYDGLHDFELSNVIRLGLVKEIKEFYANSQTIEIPNGREYERGYTNIDLDIEVDSNTDNILTELGELFINACKEKKSQ